MLDESKLKLIEEDEMSEKAEDFYKRLKLKAYEMYYTLVLQEFSEKAVEKDRRKVRRSVKKLVDKLVVYYKNEDSLKWNPEFTVPEHKDSMIHRKDVVLLYLGEKVYKDKIKLTAKASFFCLIKSNFNSKISYYRLFIFN